MREGRHAVEGFGELKSNQTDTSYCDTLSLPTHSARLSRRPDRAIPRRRMGKHVFKLLIKRMYNFLQLGTFRVAVGVSASSDSRKVILHEGVRQRQILV